MKKNYYWLIAIAVVLVLIFWIIGAYNNFISLEQSVEKSWSQVENQYQTQADKIQLLIPIVSSAVKVETKFVQDVINARTAYLSASTELAKDTAGQQMNSGVTALVNAVAENYPLLQANKQYSQLMDELAGAQNRISVERGRYIEAIQNFNTAIKRFPSNIFAKMFGFSAKDYYQSQSGTTTPKIGETTLP